jgi:hypothetical protein
MVRIPDGSSAVAEKEIALPTVALVGVIKRLVMVGPVVSLDGAGGGVGGGGEAGVVDEVEVEEDPVDGGGAGSL